HREPPEVIQRRVPADLTLADERRTVDPTEGHVVATDVDGVDRVARLDVELAGRLGHLFEDEVRIELHHVLLDALPGRTEQVTRALRHEFHTDLADQPPPAPVQHGHRVRGEDVVARHLIDEHAFSNPARARRAPQLSHLTDGGPDHTLRSWHGSSMMW